MTSKAKLKKALQLIEDVLMEGDLETGEEELEEIVTSLEDIIESN